MLTHHQPLAPPPGLPPEEQRNRSLGALLLLDDLLNVGGAHRGGRAVLGICLLLRLLELRLLELRLLELRLLMLLLKLLLDLLLMLVVAVPLP